MMDQDAKAAGSVTEATCGVGAGETVDEESAEGFVLALGGVGGFEEDPGEVR